MSVAARIGVGLLIALAVFTAILRAMVLIHGDSAWVDDTQRQLLRLVDGDAGRLFDDTKAMESRYVRHRGAMLPHVVLGAAFLLAMPLQFSTRIRTRHPAVHRWSGRVLVATGIIGVVAGMFFGFIPFGGLAESLAVFGFGTLFLVALVLGVRAIRRGDMRRHREWMIRMFWLALGAGMVRVVGLVILLIHPVSAAMLIGLSFWIGWLICVAAGESWIRATR